MIYKVYCRLQYHVLSVSGGTLVTVSGSNMDSVDSPSISSTVVLTRSMSNGITIADNGTTNYEVRNCVEYSLNLSARRSSWVVTEQLNNIRMKVFA